MSALKIWSLRFNGIWWVILSHHDAVTSATPTGSVRYSDRSIFRQVFFPTGLYSDRSIFDYIPRGRYSDRSIFRHVRPLLVTTFFCEPNRGSFLTICSANVVQVQSVNVGWHSRSVGYWSWDYLTGLWDQLPVTWSGCNQPDLNPTDHRTYIPVTWARPSQAPAGPW